MVLFQNAIKALGRILCLIFEDQILDDNINKKTKYFVETSMKKQAQTSTKNSTQTRDPGMCGIFFLNKLYY